jgi:hypothetical protein
VTAAIDKPAARFEERFPTPNLEYGVEPSAGLFGEGGSFAGDVMGSKRNVLVQLVLIEILIASIG